MSANKSRLPSCIDEPGPELGRALGRRLRYLRAQLGITQLQLSQESRIGRAYLSRLENGRILPRYATLVRVAEGLGVEVADLVRSSTRFRKP
jgi:transcriptional regulator with XRE-family HTH domain